MRRLSSHINKIAQSGFTLIELVIVIVIVGILAAVAIPNFSSTTTSAQTASNKAILGMVKSAWSVAYSSAKGAPTTSQVVAQTLDPVCTATPPNNCGNASITFGASPILTTAQITCSNC